MRRTANTGKLASTLAGLPGLDRSTLQEQWRKLYGTEPPAYISRPILIRAIAYRLQENAFGGLKPSSRRFLAQVVEGAASAWQGRLTHTVKSGTRLLREWHGVVHEVIVLEDGVTFDGKHYDSLSEVARTITGARWSGPRFFGLKKRTT